MLAALIALVALAAALAITFIIVLVVSDEPGTAFAASSRSSPAILTVSPAR